MKKCRCFSVDFNSSQPYIMIKEELRVIRMKDIIGTVDKCGELDSDFQYIHRFDRGERSRRRSIEQKTGEQHFFPPIQVNKYDKRYYIVDGHRRTSAAKQRGIEFMDAYVTTYVPESDRETRLGLHAKKRFEQETGITTVHLNSERGFDELLEDVRSFTGDNITKEATLEWKTKQFLPALKAIENSDLPSTYPTLRAEDIYVLLYQFYNDFFNGFPEHTDFSALISTYYAARFPGENRLFRGFPFRFLFSLITRKGRKKMV